MYGFECRETWAESWTESWLRTSCTAQVINYYMGMLQERELRNNPGARSLFDAAKKNLCAVGRVNFLLRNAACTHCSNQTHLR